MAKLVPGVNDLATLFPAIAARWDVAKNSIRPEQVTAGSTNKVWWKCESGHSYQAVIYSQKSSGCPVCSGKQLLIGFNDLASKKPALLSEWDYESNSIDPREISAGSSYRAKWICKTDSRHIWEASVRNRAHLNRGCPICSNNAVMPGVNDLLTTHPEIAEQWDSDKNPIKASQVVAGSNQVFWWICQKGHHYKAKPAERTGRGSGCAVCENRQIEIGVNDLPSTHPHLALEIDRDLHPELDPKSLTAGSGKHLNWKCSQGHKWKATVINRSRTGTRRDGTPITGTDCPVCKKGGSGKRATNDYNLITSHPELAKEWDFSVNARGPESYTKGVSEKVSWVCEKGHKWQALIINRAYLGQGCPVCANQKTVDGQNDLASLFPHIAQEWHPTRNLVSPREVQPGSPASYWWLCDKDHSFRASPVNRTRGGTGCPSCANSGFDPTENGYLYLLRKEFQGLQQFGITNFPDKRLRTHKANGWELLDVIGPADGYWISDTERLLKKYFRSLGLLLPRSYPDKFDGYSESWKATEKTYEQLSELISDLRAWEESRI